MLQEFWAARVFSFPKKRASQGLTVLLKYWKVWLAFNGRKLSGLFSLKSNHILSNRSKSINCQHFYSMYIQDCNYIWFVSWNVGIKIDCPIFDLSILYYIARDLHNILTFHNQVTVRKTKIKKSFSLWQNNNKSWNAIPNYTLADPVSSILGERNDFGSILLVNFISHKKIHKVKIF